MRKVKKWKLTGIFVCVIAMVVHVYGVKEADYKRMADHNIYVTSGMLWHHA